MRSTRGVMTAVIAVLGIASLASAQGGKTPKAAAPNTIRVDQAAMQQTKARVQKAMSAHKAWIDKNLEGWPEKTKEVVATTIASYGEPQGVTRDLLVWGKSGPWKRMIIHRDPVPHSFPMPHEDVLEQFVDYSVAPEKFDELAQYDGSVVAARTAGELSARCDKEEANYLALNLARDVAEGKKSVAQARDYYANAIKGMLQGKMDEYLKGLKFDQQQGGDKDEARFPNPAQQALRD